MQGTLFDTSSTQPETIHLDNGELLFYPQWLPSAKADLYFSSLLRQVAWEQSIITIAGKQIKIPRLNAWYGDENSHYQYSGADFAPLAWIRPLDVLRAKLHTTLNRGFNSALVNLYRDGNDSVAWHADNERELGQNPVIASISLGQERRFLLKPKNKSLSRSKNHRVELILPHGSLLVMQGATQHYWHHSIPKSAVIKEPRINLTFRNVRPGPN